MPAKFSCKVKAGDRLRIETPGGGGFGAAEGTGAGVATGPPAP
jgi:N-methylhydantoinase B/oxoprolinase/acetone carboxylase alpha subunit